MGVAAYNALIMFQGIPTLMNVEPMTNVGGAYQVTNPAKRVLDRTYGVSFLINGFPVDEPGEVIDWVDYLNGVVYLLEDYEGEPGDVWTITAKYIPLSEPTGGYNYALNLSVDLLDDTNFKDVRTNGPWRTRIYGLQDVSFSFGRDSDYGQQFIDMKRNREVVLIQVNPGGDPSAGYRGWFVVEQDGHSGDIGSKEDEQISFNLDGEYQKGMNFTWYEEF